MSDATSPETRDEAARVMADAMGGWRGITAPSPLLAASTEQLAAAMAEHIGLGSMTWLQMADALLASGAVVPAASLADDEALVERVSRESWPSHSGVYSRLWAAKTLRALAAALEDR